MDCGPVVYYPGSHRLPEVTMDEIGENADEAQYSEYVIGLIEREGLEPHYATIRKGEVFLWASNLLHGGSARKDATRTRHSQVTHFFFEGCRYYSPLLSRGDEVHEFAARRIRHRRPPRRREEPRSAPDRAVGAHGRVHPARNHLTGSGEELCIGKIPTD